MRATDIDNARLIDQARATVELYRTLEEQRQRLADGIVQIKAHKERHRFDRSTYKYDQELWTLSQQLYLTRRTLRFTSRRLWLEVCVLHRRLDEDYSVIYTLIGAKDLAHRIGP